MHAASATAPAARRAAVQAPSPRPRQTPAPVPAGPRLRRLSGGSYRTRPCLRGRHQGRRRHPELRPQPQPQGPLQPHSPSRLREGRRHDAFRAGLHGRPPGAGVRPWSTAQARPLGVRRPSAGQPSIPEALRLRSEDRGRARGQGSPEAGVENGAGRRPDAVGERPTLTRTARRRIETKGSDPVDMATGKMFLPQTDVALPGTLPLVFTRRALESGYHLGRWFGPSWSSTVDQRLEIDSEGVDLRPRGRPPPVLSAPRARHTHAALARWLPLAPGPRGDTTPSRTRDRPDAALRAPQTNSPYWISSTTATATGSPSSTTPKAPRPGCPRRRLPPEAHHGRGPVTALHLAGAAPTAATSSSAYGYTEATSPRSSTPGPPTALRLRRARPDHLLDGHQRPPLRLRLRRPPPLCRTVGAEGHMVRASPTAIRTRPRPADDHRHRRGRPRGAI